MLDQLHVRIIVVLVTDLFSLVIVRLSLFLLLLLCLARRLLLLGL